MNRRETVGIRVASYEDQDASHRTTVDPPGQTFVFDPNQGLSTIGLSRVGGVDHDTPSCAGADDGNSIADAPHDTHRMPDGSSAILDPTTDDAASPVGITERESAAYTGQENTFNA